VAVSPSVHPLLKPFTFRVVEVLMTSGTRYAVDPELGSLPSVVYRSVALGVVVSRVTVGGDVKVPPPGEKVEVATFIV
jgi:hypothetical protein